MKADVGEIENVLKAYKSELERLDLALPALLLGNDSGPRPAQILRPLPEALPGLAEEIDGIWERLEERRIGPGPSKNAWNLSAAALAGLALTGAAVFVYLQPVPAPHAPASGERTGEAFPAVPFPAEEASGLALRGGAFLSLDFKSEELVILDPGSARVIRRAALPAGGIRSVAAGSAAFLAADGKGWLYEIDPESLAILGKTPLPAGGSAALHFDGNSLWSADENGIYRLSADTGHRVLAKSSGPARKINGLARVGEFLWTSEAGSAVLRRYWIGAGLKASGAAHIGHLLPAGASLCGFAIEEDSAWLLSGSPAQLRRVPLGRIRFHAD